MGAFISLIPAPLSGPVELWWGLSTRLLNTLIVGAGAYDSHLFSFIQLNIILGRNGLTESDGIQTT